MTDAQPVEGDEDEITCPDCNGVGGDCPRCKGEGVLCTDCGLPHLDCDCDNWEEEFDYEDDEEDEGQADRFCDPQEEHAQWGDPDEKGE